MLGGKGHGDGGCQAESVSAFVSVKLLDIFKETLEQLPAMFVTL